MTKQTKWVCAQRRLRSAWTSAQSDQSLRCALNGWLRTQAFFIRTAKTLIRLGGCAGWSESSLGAHSFCCFFCHDAAYKILIYLPKQRLEVEMPRRISSLCHCCNNIYNRVNIMRRRSFHILFKYRFNWDFMVHMRWFKEQRLNLFHWRRFIAING